MTGSSLRHPDRIGPYRLVQLLGEGGMGVVYEAEQKEPVRRRVALKMMKVGMDTREVLGRFESERQALAVMEHPGIAKVFDAGITDEGRPYFVMELVKGIPLTAYADRRQLTNRERIELMIRVCEAVQHAHQKGVIHRDLKPSNVLVVDENGTPSPKVIDFGVAKATGQRLTDRTVVTTHGQVMGTLAYMSPEQADKAGLDVDTRTDIYSLGVMLHELMTGDVPVNPMQLGDLAFAALLLQRDRPMPSLSQHLTKLRQDEVERRAALRRTDVARLSRQLRGDVQWIVAMAMDKDRGRRYHTANGLAMDLRRYLDNEPVVARAPTASYRLRKFLKRNRAVAIGTGMAALALVAGSVLATAGMLQARRAEELARREAESAEQVAAFLEGLFEMSNPSEARGNTFTAREILEAGAERISNELSSDPLLRSRMMASIGRVYESLAQLDRAEQMLRGAIALQEADPSTRPDALARNLTDLGGVLAERGEVEEADSMIARAATLLHGEQNHALEYARTISTLGYHRALFGGDVAAGDSLVGEAIEIKEGLLGPDDPAVAADLARLAFFHDGEPDYAEPIQRRVVGIYQRSYGWSDPRTLGQAHNLYLTLLSSDIREAESLMRRVVGEWEASYGEDHPSLATARMDFSLLFHDTGRHDEAVELLRPAVEFLRDRLGDDAPETAYARLLLGRSLALQGELGQAELDLDAAYSTLQSTVGPNHNWTAQASTGLGVLRRLQGRRVESESLLRRALNLQSSIWGVTHRNVYEPSWHLGVLLEEEQRWSGADSAYARALQICRATTGDGHPCSRQVAEALARVRRAHSSQGSGGGTPK
jgi:serine/threonine protein kinase